MQRKSERAPPLCQKCNSPIDPSLGHCLKCKKAELMPFLGPVPRDYTKKDTKEDLRLVLIGKTGGGKSATANTIIGKQAFTSKRSLSSVTKTCQYEYADRFDRVVQLVDTPGLFDTSLKKEVVETEIKKSIGLSSPGPHAFLLVISLTCRFTEDEEKVFKEIDGMFGEGMTRHMIVVFTCRDEIAPKTESEFLLGAPECLEQLIERAGGGYLSFNNNGEDEEKERDVKCLFSRIDEMMVTNKAPFFPRVYEQGEGMMKEKINRRLNEEYDKIIEPVVEEQLQEDVEEKMKKEKEFCQKLQKAAPQMVESMKKEKEASRLKSSQTDAATENILANMLEKETEILVKTDETKTQIEKAKGAERTKMHDELARDEEKMKKMKAEREKAEDRVKKERLMYTMSQIEQMIREQERENIQNGDIHTLSTLQTVINIMPGILNLFQES